jgi:putative phosphoribosyl transferase
MLRFPAREEPDMGHDHHDHHDLVEQQLSRDDHFELPEVTIPDEPDDRRARLAVPRAVRAVVVFVHGGGAGGRTSIRDGYVADRMHERGLATVLVDLLTRDESAELTPATEVTVLAERIGRVVDFVSAHAATAGRPLAVVGSGTGSAAALRAVASGVRHAVAVVCSGGPIELASDVADQIDVPVLVLVGEHDPDAAERAAAVFAAMRCERRLDTVPGAQFDGVASVDRVAEGAIEWVLGHLPDG